MAALLHCDCVSLSMVFQKHRLFLKHVPSFVFFRARPQQATPPHRAQELNNQREVLSALHSSKCSSNRRLCCSRCSNDGLFPSCSFRTAHCTANFTCPAVSLEPKAKPIVRRTLKELDAICEKVFAASDEKWRRTLAAVRVQDVQHKLCTKQSTCTPRHL